MEQDKAILAACAAGSSQCETLLAEALDGAATQQDLVLAGKLPDFYWGTGSDFSATAKLLSSPQFKGATSEQAAQMAADLAGIVIDFTPGLGDIKAFMAAETPFDYTLAAVGVLGPVGDGVAKLVKEAKLAMEAGDAARAVGKVEEAADASNRATHEAYKASLRESMEKPAVTDARLGRIVDSLYRENATIGSGSTAAAVRYERETGLPVGSVYHEQRARDSIVALEKWLERNPKAFPGDRAAAENTIRDMKDALEGRR